jgi:metal-responsive CopG/Arc/MetJ family transcriptional regulator
LTVRVPQEVLDAVEQWAKRNGAESRSDAVRQLLEQALAAPKAKAKGRK